MELTRLAIVAVAAFFAGSVNAVAGGGSLLTFPALLAAGVPPVIASATNTVALAPGAFAAAIGYRKELVGHRRTAAWFAGAAALGSLVGAYLLLSVPERFFRIIVPVLILSATLALLLQRRVAAFARATEAAPSRRRVAWVALGFAVVSIYGGYFAAGIGIVTLTLLALSRSMTIHEMNAQKTVIVGTINTVAASFFLLQGAPALGYALVMALFALAGGYTGARVARRVPAATVSRVVVALGVLASVVLAVRYWS